MAIEVINWFHQRRKECDDDELWGETIVDPGQKRSVEFIPGVPIQIECDSGDCVGMLSSRDWDKLHVEVYSDSREDEGDMKLVKRSGENAPIYRGDTWYVMKGPRCIEISFHNENEGGVAGLGHNPEELI